MVAIAKNELVSTRNYMKENEEEEAAKKRREKTAINLQEKQTCLI